MFELVDTNDEPIIDKKDDDVYKIERKKNIRGVRDKYW